MENNTYALIIILSVAGILIITRTLRGLAFDERLRRLDHHIAAHNVLTSVVAAKDAEEQRIQELIAASPRDEIAIRIAFERYTLAFSLYRTAICDFGHCLKLNVDKVKGSLDDAVDQLNHKCASYTTGTVEDRELQELVEKAERTTIL